ncbi:hypothetical protein DRP77_01330 [Candidatus Poribacteria bacterium]|nr:MAG: hypothetical protein DRP77_01330 [Candidatus Poribacteria bacterium]
MGEVKWVEFGWQGIKAIIPSDWEIGALSGDWRSGYLRLEDSLMPRLELKWSTHKRKPDLHAILDGYFKNLRKEERKKGEGLRIRRGVKLVKDLSAFEGKEVVFFTCRSSRFKANGMIWFCPECRRTLIAQLNAAPGEGALLRETGRIFSSIKDHPEGETNLWTAYGLSVEVPRRYKLESHKMMSAYLMLSFADGSRKVVVERYGLAEVLLKDSSFEEWFRRVYSKELKGYGFTLKGESPVPGHDGLKLEGEKVRFTDKIPIPLLSLLNAPFRRRRISIRAWRCVKSNRIFVVRVMAKGDTSRIADRISSTIECHVE